MSVATIRLADFIVDNMEQILQAWEDFAATVVPAAHAMDCTELRDHAAQMLAAIARDLRTTQTSKQQIAKSHGKGPVIEGETAAETHALTRLMSGFTIDQMISEYRALRTSVLMLWSRNMKDGLQFELEDMTRFNEAIDQALAESVARYSQAVRESQNIFLGILGHDLRTPLGAISMAAELLAHSKDLDSRQQKIVSRIDNSVGRAKNIVETLLDFTRSHLGGGIPVKRINTDLAAICSAMVDEVNAHHPTHRIVFESSGEVTGMFDPDRMEQVFSNLIENAVKHGGNTAPVMVRLQATGNEIEFSVMNEGEVISESDRLTIFNPMARHSEYASRDRGSSAGLGLGLYIVQEIVTAHQGRIDVESNRESGTVFRVCLTRDHD